MEGINQKINQIANEIKAKAFSNLQEEIMKALEPQILNQKKAFDASLGVIRASQQAELKDIRSTTDEAVLSTLERITKSE